jgi:hypothetical protein
LKGYRDLGGCHTKHHTTPDGLMQKCGESRWLEDAGRKSRFASSNPLR